MSKYLDTRPDDGDPPALRRSGITCAEANDLIPAQALGVIETGERHALQLHCQSCPACADTLDDSRRVTAFLPFAGPSLAPPDRVKQDLFARIANAQPAAAFASPTLTSTVTIDAPVIDSPASKRSRPDAVQMRPPVREVGASSWALPLWSGRVTKLAAGPLALVIVLVTLYSMQVIDSPFTTSNDGGVPTPQSGEVANNDASTSDSTDTDSSSAADTDDPVEMTQSEAALGLPIGDVTFTYGDSQSAVSTQPVFQTYAAVGGDAFTYRTLSASSGQTELLRAVAPNQATCTLAAAIGSRAYTLTVSNIHLPSNGHVAGVYLITADGEQLYVGAVVIDELGNGSMTFTLNQPIDDFRSLQVGPVSSEPGNLVDAPYFSAASFLLSWNDINRGLSPAS